MADLEVLYSLNDQQSVKGISHNEGEAIKPQWPASGAQMLLHTLAHLANELD